MKTVLFKAFNLVSFQLLLSLALLFLTGYSKLGILSWPIPENLLFVHFTIRISSQLFCVSACPVTAGLLVAWSPQTEI